jgi:Zn finger protein HypA/HybF involved in hydrogenase expression
MIEKQIMNYCEKCDKETVQVAREDAFEIKYYCKECNSDKTVVKTYF